MSLSFSVVSCMTPKFWNVIFRLLSRSPLDMSITYCNLVHYNFLLCWLPFFPLYSQLIFILFKYYNKIIQCKKKLHEKYNFFLKTIKSQNIIWKNTTQKRTTRKSTAINYYLQYISIFLCLHISVICVILGYFSVGIILCFANLFNIVSFSLSLVTLTR